MCPLFHCILGEELKDVDRTLFDTFANRVSHHSPPVILLLPGEVLKDGHVRVKLFFYNPGNANGKSEDIPIVEDGVPLSKDAGNYFTIRTYSHLPIINQFHPVNFYAFFSFPTTILY